MTKSPTKPVKPAEPAKPIRAESERRVRMLVDIDAKLDQKIKKFRAEKHIATLDSAIRRLIERGLCAEADDDKEIARIKADARLGKPRPRKP